MIRMLIVGYVFAIRSERQLCSEVQVNLAYRWFCRLSIEEKIPDHSVFSRARHERFRESDALRRVFEGVVATCIAAGLVGGEAFSVDASLIKADVDKKKRVPGEQPIAWSGDGRSLYIYRPGDLPTQVSKLDISTGQRTPFRQLMPSDPAGVETLGPILLTPDGKTCVYGYHRTLSDLYLVEGQK